MRKILCLISIFILLHMNTMANNTLTERQLHLATLASLEAQGDMIRLESALEHALDAGVTINDIKETFSQLYAYTGFPRALNALGVLKKVLDTRKAEGKITNEGKTWTAPTVWNDATSALEQGTENQTKLSGRPFDYDFCPQIDHYLKAHLFGDIFAGTQLLPADRELITVAALASLQGVAPQLAAHKAGAVNMGNTPEQVEELLSYLSSKGLSQYDDAAETNAGAWPKGNANIAYAQYFIGNSYLANLTPKNLNTDERPVLPLNNVTFAPGCRNNWHIHHGAKQILICVSGKGWYQEWGKEAIPLSAGDVIEIPEGAKHWHGAQKDCWFQHVVTHISVPSTQPNSEANEWLEPVSEEQYNKLK